MTGSYFRGDSEAVLAPSEETKFETVTYTYYEQLNGYRWLKSLDIGYFFYTGRMWMPSPRCWTRAENHRPHSQRQCPREPQGQGARG
jgi:hypothetical protein